MRLGQTLAKQHKGIIPGPDHPYLSPTPPNMHMSEHLSLNETRLACKQVRKAKQHKDFIDLICDTEVTLTRANGTVAEDKARSIPGAGAMLQDAHGHDMGL